MAERFRIPWTTGEFEMSQPECSIAPPPEPSDTQVGEWLIDDGYPWDSQEEAVITITASRLKNVARQAAQWGADQELEACCDALDNLNDGFWSEKLRAVRRPKPPSLKEQALAGLAEWENVMDIAPDSPIRRALEQLDD